MVKARRIMEVTPANKIGADRSVRLIERTQPMRPMPPSCAPPTALVFGQFSPVLATRNHPFRCKPAFFARAGTKTRQFRGWRREAGGGRQQNGGKCDSRFPSCFTLS